MARDAKVDNPAHYGGADNPYEAIKVIEAWDLGFCLGSAVKYISRMGKKPGESALTDLKKTRWYVDREIQKLEKLAAKRRADCNPAHAPGECSRCKGVFCIHGTDCTVPGTRCKKCDAIDRRIAKRKR